MINAPANLKGLPALAALLLLPAGTAFAQPVDETADTWKFSLAPFLWAMNINGTSRIGATAAALNLDFKDDLLDNLDSALMVHFEASKGRTSLFAEYQYSKLKPEEVLANGATANADYKNILGELGAGYTINGLSSDATLQVIGGARYYSQELDAGLASGPTLVHVDESWWDAFLGGRVFLPLAEKWQLVIRADGATGGSKETWQAAGYFNWRFNDWGSLLFGYRYMNINYDNDKQGNERYVYDADQQGPLLGVNFYW